MRNTRAGSLRPSENPPVVSTSRASAPSDRLTRATAGQPSPPDGRTVVIVPSTARRLTVAPCRENNFAGWPNDEVVDRVNLCQFYEWAIGSPATVNGDGSQRPSRRVRRNNMVPLTLETIGSGAELLDACILRKGSICEPGYDGCDCARIHSLPAPCDDE